MNNPFESFGNAERGPGGLGCDPGSGPGFGPGFGPGHLHRRHHREMRNQMRDHLRSHAGGGDLPFGFGPGFGPAFGPGFSPGFGPGGGFGPGFGPGGPRGRRGHGRGRGRTRRGDVRSAILVLLAERAMHGYEMIQEIAERSNGIWKPSPGSVYPTLQLLVDEGLIVGSESGSSRKLFELTEAGRTAAAAVVAAPWDEITEGIDPHHLQLRDAVGQLFGAVAQAAHAASPEQQQRIIDIVNKARREVYQILGEAE